MKSLGEARIAVCRAAIAKSLWERSAEFASGLEPDQLERLVGFGIRQCQKRGFDLRTHIYTFVKMLLQDEEYPIPAERLKEKTDRIFRDFEAAALFVKLQSLKSRMPDAQSKAAAGGEGR